MNDSRMDLLETFETGEISQTKIVPETKQLIGPFLLDEKMSNEPETNERRTRAAAGELK